VEEDLGVAGAARALSEGDGARVLVADVDAATGCEIARALEREGFEVEFEPSVAGARRAIAAGRFAAVVLSLAFVDDAFELCQSVRAAAAVPIIAVGAQYSDADCVRALRSGADDYVSRHASAAVLRARVSALLRRTPPRATGGAAVRRVGAMTLDLARQGAVVDGSFVKLTRSELSVLGLLADPPRKARTRAEIMAHLWRSEHVGCGRACDIHILNLRRKLERDPRAPERIVTVRSYGYRLEPGEER
jgi:DNA-binding response OmpR family regulator